MPHRIAFQGEHGAFSELAARKLLGAAIETLPCTTFDDVFAAVSRGDAGAALIPIENTLAGSVLRNYELLGGASLQIHGEVLLRINHNLIGHPGVELREIRRIMSHPVALAQCQRFLALLEDVEVVAEYDTAGSVKLVMAGGRRDEAAIAGAWAAEIYGAQVIAKSVEDHHENYTRFLLVAPSSFQVKLAEEAASAPKKTTLLFRTPNKPGALFRALAVFALRDLNLTKIESRPIEGRPWEYSFYLDVSGDVSDPPLARALDHLREMCEVVVVLGSYPQALVET